MQLGGFEASFEYGKQRMTVWAKPEDFACKDLSCKDSACKDFACLGYLAGFVTARANDFSALACFRINSHCFRACVPDSSKNSAAVLAPASSCAYSRAVPMFAFIKSSV